MVREKIEKTVAAQPSEFCSLYFRYGPFSQRNDFSFLVREVVIF
jgi:hypothetical protein